MTEVTKSQFEFLRSIDSPTVCNLLEIVAPERRGHGYTVRHLHCPFPDLKRLDYLDYVAASPQPGIAVIQDLDDIVGYGAFWGEVQSRLRHQREHPRYGGEERRPIHADRYGAVVVPLETIGPMQGAADGLAAKEAKIIKAAQAGAGLEAIKAAMKG